MIKRFVLNCLLLGLMLVSVGHAQEEDVPVVAMIQLGSIPAFELAQQGVRDIFEHYGYEEGEDVTYWYGNAEFDIEIAHALVEQAIAAEADVLITITTPVSLAALEITSTMENPPIVLFSLVTDPYAAGLVESPCIKVPHISGSQLSEPYADVFALIPEFDPNIETVGYLYNDEEANSVVATEIVSAAAEEWGIDLAIGVVHSPEEVAPVAETLAIDGVDAFFIGADSTVASNLANLLELADEIDVPVFAVTTNQVGAGATIGIGASTYFGGVDIGLMAVGYLNDTIDIATLAVSRQEGFSLGINYDAAEAQNVTIPESLIELSDFQVQDGESNQTVPSLDEFSDEDIEAMNAAFVEAQTCTEERIAEEQAALDSEE